MHTVKKVQIKGFKDTDGESCKNCERCGINNLVPTPSRAQCTVILRGDNVALDVTQNIGQNDNTGGIFVNSERGVGILLRRWVCRGEYTGPGVCGRGKFKDVLWHLGRAPRIDSLIHVFKAWVGIFA